jgi:hypothetical protein
MEIKGNRRAFDGGKETLFEWIAWNMKACCAKSPTD